MHRRDRCDMSYDSFELYICKDTKVCDLESILEYDRNRVDSYGKFEYEPEWESVDEYEYDECESESEYEYISESESDYACSSDYDELWDREYQGSHPLFTEWSGMYVLSDVMF